MRMYVIWAAFWDATQVIQMRVQIRHTVGYVLSRLGELSPILLEFRLRVQSVKTT